MEGISQSFDDDVLGMAFRTGICRELETVVVDTFPCDTNTELTVKGELSPGGGVVFFLSQEIVSTAAADAAFGATEFDLGEESVD